MGEIKIGTCSWSDHTGFYPPGLKPTDRITYYARHFPVVEIDSTYYHMQPVRNFAAWASRTPPGFVFDVKAYKAMTRHERTPQETTPLPIGEVFRQFAESLSPLRQTARLGAVLLQFPPWFVEGEENRAYLRFCREAMPDFLLAVEFRHRSWFEGEARDRTLGFLQELDFVHVVADAPQVGTGTVPLVAEVTSPKLSIFRLHGRNRATWYARTETTGQRFDYRYTQKELEGFLPVIERLAEKTDEVHVLMNNNREDFAVRNAYELSALLALGYPDPFNDT